MAKQALIEVVVCFCALFSALGIATVIGMLVFMWDDIKTTLRRK